jgi:hypothetical protein
MPHPVLDAPISPLRQRLIDDMNMRRFSRETQRNYLRDIGRLATFLGRLPDTATADDLRRFQIEQQEDGVPALSPERPGSPTVPKAIERDEHRPLPSPRRIFALASRAASVAWFARTGSLARPPAGSIFQANCQFAGTHAYPVSILSMRPRPGNG